MNPKKAVSLRVIRRISFYYEALLKLNLRDDEYVSSKELEAITGISCNQIRQDFFSLNIAIGKQKKGYLYRSLFNELKKVLSIDKGAKIIIVGAGRIGMALSNYKLFRIRNINVVALFDVKPELINATLQEKPQDVIPIFHINELENFLKQNPEVKIGLITVPEDVAQQVLESLVRAGIQGVVNFAPRVLHLPEGYEHVDLINDCIGTSLYKIVYQLNTRS